MREITIKLYYMTKDDKQAFVSWLKEQKMTASYFAKERLHISKSHLSEILNGKNALTEKMKLAFNEGGYKL